jgi:hypothetical protein
MIINKEVSQDGILTLIIKRTDDADYLLGFENYPWHTHGDLLLNEYGLQETSSERAVKAVFTKIIEDKIPLVVSVINNEVKDVRVTDDISSELKYIKPNEQLIFRYWSGKLISPK